MKTFTKVLMTMLAVIAWNTAQAETVSPYEVDFNSAITTGNHDFAVSSNWGHIVGVYEDSWANGYMSYSYSSSEGIGESGTLLAYRQYAQNIYSEGAVCYDLLVTPKVTGMVTLMVKPSSLATSSNPAMVEFYDVDEAGTTRGELIQKFTADDGFIADEANPGWYAVSISVDTEKRVGIRAQYVYMDNFSATSATIVPERKLTIKSVADVDGASTTYFDQQADGTILARYLVTLTNSGEVDLNTNDENYTLSLFNRSAPATLYGAFPIPVSLAVGATSDPIEMQVFLPADQKGWKYWDVKENISGTTKEGKWCGTKTYESKFIFDKAGTSYNNSSSPTKKEIAFGKVTEATTVNYEIYNGGIAPLTINSFTIDAPFTTNAPAGEFTVEAKEKKAIDITFPATEPGIFNGTITITYTDFGKEQATYTLPVSATVIDPSKNFITFDNGKAGDEFNGQFPAGSIHYDQVYITSSGSGSELNYYLQSVNDKITKFVTPLLTAENGETFTFDAFTTPSSTGSSSPYVIVYTSKDRENWTQLLKTENNALGSTPKTFTATIEEGGDIYLAFELNNNALLDNIYGLTLAEQPEHNWVITDQSIPTKGKQNTEYTATITLHNINAEADVVETATLYVDGEAVVTVSNTDLPGNDKTAAEGTGRNHYSNMEAPLVITLSYKPHTFGTLQAFIELKSGDDVVTTEVVDVTIAEEKTESLIAIGEEKTTSTNVPFYALWGDDSKGLAECDVLYTAEILTKFGLKKDDKISAINFPGTPTGTKTFNNLTVEAWVGLLGANESFVAGEADKGNMQYVKLYDAESVTFTTDETVDFTITLPEPIVWDGVSDLRVTTNLNGNGTYLNIKFNVDNTYTNNGNYSHGGGTWNSTYLPVAYITLDVQANTLSGIVTEEDETTPVAGATVTIRNAENDIEYFATTNEAGAYTINVVQNSLTYTATVTAEGYETLVDDEELNFTENSLTKSYQLIKTTVPVVVTIGQYGYATFYYSNSAYVIPDDVEAKAVESINGKTLSLIPVSGIIPAGCAVILEGEQGDYTFEPTSEEGIAVETILRGTDNKEMIEAEEQECKYYKLTTKDGKVGFYYGAENGAIFENEAHKAYLPVPVSQSNGVNFFTFDDATGIKQLQTNDQETERFYNLSGQRVNDSYKGVVIVNGKKALKK